MVMVKRKTIDIARCMFQARVGGGGEVAGGDSGGGMEASMRESMDRVSRLEEQAAQLAHHLTAKEDMIGVRTACCYSRYTHTLCYCECLYKRCLPQV